MTAATEQELAVASGQATLHGTLNMPRAAHGIVVFAHGSGSSRHSPRNRAVAHRLQHAGFGTLLMDLLTPEEEAAEQRGAMKRFDIGLLATRLTDAIDHVGRWNLPVALIGSSTGAGAALISATERDVYAVVSRGGRPDLARDALPDVRCPVLLLVGARDEVVLELNRHAQQRLPDAQVQVVPTATHLFEEPGTLEEVAEKAAQFLHRNLPIPRGEAKART